MDACLIRKRLEGGVNDLGYVHLWGCSTSTANIVIFRLDILSLAIGVESLDHHSWMLVWGRPIQPLFINYFTSLSLIVQYFPSGVDLALALQAPYALIRQLFGVVQWNFV